MKTYLTKENIKNNESNGVLLYYKNLDHKSKKEIIDLAVNCYSHLINGKFTFGQWSEIIKQNYDISDKRNLAIYTAIKNTSGIIENYLYTGQTIVTYKK